jgi:hypothetical protein
VHVQPPFMQPKSALASGADAAYWTLRHFPLRKPPVAFQAPVLSHSGVARYETAPVSGGGFVRRNVGHMVKPRGRHPERALTEAADFIRIPGRYSDGNGLYLVVSSSGAKRWVQRIVVGGRRRDLGLSGFPLVSLEEARAKALACRQAVRARGRDAL